MIGSLGNSGYSDPSSLSSIAAGTLTHATGLGPQPRRCGPRASSHQAWRIDVLGRDPPLTRASQSLVAAIRAAPGPYPTVTAGRAAAQHDQHASIRSKLALALIILGSTTLIVLFVMTGSLVLPGKSLIMNGLTLSATFGVLVLVFQDGRLQGLLGFSHSGALEQTNMVILFIIAFGLSTDSPTTARSGCRASSSYTTPARATAKRSRWGWSPARVVTAAAFCAGAARW